MYDFSDQVALVTGASRGIGLKVSETLACYGVRVVLASRHETDVRRRAEAICSQGGKASFVGMDVSRAKQVKSAISQVLEQFKKVDILVNNAGIARDSLLLRMKEEDWRQVMSTNLDGMYLVTQQVLRGMLRKRFGRVINITSVVAQIGNVGQANYVASKAGVIGFTKALSREVSSRNITVNAVAPGFIDTDMTARLGDRVRSELTAQIPLKRLGTVEDVASGVLFLASKEAGYITGHVLNINGGMYM